MGQNLRKLPTGIQNFEDLRTGGYIYIDKTMYIHRLITQGKPYFLSRPRRFGKSLLLSTMKAYFEGKRELFEGLAITELTRDDPDAFAEYPVFYFDFNGANYSKVKGTINQIRQNTEQMIIRLPDVTDTVGENVEADRKEADDPGDPQKTDEETGSGTQRNNTEDTKETTQTIEDVLDEHLRRWEKIYGFDPANKTLSARFKFLLEAATKQTGRRAVVLVDEYDKPLLESNPVLDEYNRAVFKGFFGTLKSYDAYLKFVFITGVTKFSKVSIFSDLNQLIDISLDERYSGICGISEAEIRTNLCPEVEALAQRRELTVEECFDKLKCMYDGYHFAEISDGMYNPFSLLNAFSEKKFGFYWFESGTPTFLIQKMKETRFDPKTITESRIYADEKTISDYRTDNRNPVPLLYQTGYLTIRNYNKKYNSYILGYPNDEVKYGFLDSLVPLLLHQDEPDQIEETPLNVVSFGMDLDSGNVDNIRDRLTALFASLPYPEGNPDEFDKYIERDFQNVIYITFMLLGQYVKAQVHNAVGRADVIVETDDYVYIFEFKRDKTAAEALQQIEDKGYALPYSTDPRTLFKIGVNFDSLKRNISEWEVLR